MTKIKAEFYISVLAKAKIANKNTTRTIDKIITTTLVTNGEIIIDKEQIDVYTKYEEFYDYDISEAKPLENGNFETINHIGEKSSYYNGEGYEIKEIIEIFEHDIINTRKYKD